MPIKNIQPRLAEAIRIRTGSRGEPNADGYRRPMTSDTFILTSPHRDLIGLAADVFGGTPEEWREPTAVPPDQYRVVTERSSLDVLIPPAPNTFSQWNERWSAAGCLRRCDGELDTITGDKCDCPCDPLEKVTLAKKGQACKETTNLTVVIRELEELVGARYVSHSYYTALEMLATGEYFTRLAFERGMFIPARLAIVERHGAKRSDGPPRKFKVTTLSVPLAGALDVASLGTGEGSATPRAIETSSSVGPAAAPPEPRVRQADHNAMNLAELARELDISQRDILLHARQLAEETGQTPPSTLVDIATSPLLEEVIVWMRGEEDRF